MFASRLVAVVRAHSSGQKGWGYRVYHAAAAVAAGMLAHYGTSKTCGSSENCQSELGNSAEKGLTHGRSGASFKDLEAMFKPTSMSGGAESGDVPMSSLPLGDISYMLKAERQSAFPNSQVGTATGAAGPNNAAQAADPAAFPFTKSAKFSTRLRNMLQNNGKFVAEGLFKEHALDKQSQAGHRGRCIVVTCMDTRLTTLLPAALGIRAGDAKVIKNAGAVIAHPFGGIMRSVVVALYELNCDEVFVIGHYDCGMSSLNGAGTLHKMEERGGIPRETIKTMQYAGIDLHRWLHGFDSVQESVRTSVDIIRNHPLVPKDVPVHGLIIDPYTGKLDLIVDGTMRMSQASDLQDAQPPRFSKAVVYADVSGAAVKG